MPDSLKKDAPADLSTHLLVITPTGTPTHVLVPVADYVAHFGDLPVPSNASLYGRPILPPPFTVDTDGVPQSVRQAVEQGLSPLAAWRRYFRLKQGEMAERMGVSRPSYTQMEKGKKHQHATLVKAAAAFGIPLSVLMVLYEKED